MNFNPDSSEAHLPLTICYASYSYNFRLKYDSNWYAAPETRFPTLFQHITHVFRLNSKATMYTPQHHCPVHCCLIAPNLTYRNPLQLLCHSLALYYSYTYIVDRYLARFMPGILGVRHISSSCGFPLSSSWNNCYGYFTLRYSYNLVTVTLNYYKLDVSVRWSSVYSLHRSFIAVNVALRNTVIIL